MKLNEILETVNAVEPEKESALLHYLRDSSWLNSGLRYTDGKNHLEIQSKSVKLLDEFIKNSPLTKSGLVLYRAIPRHVLEDLKEGDKFVDKGFISTSSNKQSVNDPGYVHPEDRVVLTLRIEPGIHALNVSEVIKQSSSAPTKAKELSEWEDEFLLERGLTFEIQILKYRKTKLIAAILKVSR